jgi:fructose/tagatose bisphosphate aldolase
MKYQDTMDDLLVSLNDSVSVAANKAEINNIATLQENIYKLAEISALESGVRQGMARYLIRLIALAGGIYPASIHDLYMARGRGDVPPDFTVPAMNLRALSFDAGRAVFRVAKSMDAGAFILEIARSEIGYTDQRPSEYTASVLAAALAEGYEGPVFIQGDHFQVSAKRYQSAPDKELQAVRDITEEAIKAGFFNIDIDSSTLVDLSKATIPEQQALNGDLTAMFTAFIRDHEPEGVTISVGGEIGEVGGENSTEPELRAYMDVFRAALEKVAPAAPGLSKISIQTGTSHGGVVLPDGSIQEVSVDFDTLYHLSRMARLDYGLAGTVQHGASTLPESAFGKFVECEACEVHLATNFQNMMFERLPEELKAEIYSYLSQNLLDERKPGMTDEQFYYKTRKRSIGPFKSALWGLGDDLRGEIGEIWEEQFRMLFELLEVGGTRKFVDEFIQPVLIRPEISDYLGEETAGEEARDLAD